MPRAEVGTPKYIANKMKAKGLQKLRWYCQMCQKQCRDENGFKCHTMSESHQRQLLLFADNSRKFIDEFSFDFAKGYIQILKRQFGSKRVNANRVYQEYIKDRDHIHMNATRWVTLGGFVKWMGRTGKAIIDETEKGWFITYIEKDPEQIAKEERKNKKLKMDKTDEEKVLEFVEKQVKLGQQKAESTSKEETEIKEFERADEEPLKLDIKLETKRGLDKTVMPINKLFKKPEVPEKKFKKEDCKKTALDEIREMEEIKKEKQNRKDYWLCEGIVVKVVTKTLGEEFYKQKGVVREVFNKFGAVVKLLESGKKIKVDQEHLETVIPALNRNVRIVNGAYRGEIAELLSIDEKNFCVEVEIAQGVLKGRRLKGVQYEDICKIYE